MEDQRQEHLPIFVNVGGIQSMSYFVLPFAAMLTVFTVMSIKYADYIRSLDKDALDTRQYRQYPTT